MADLKFNIDKLKEMRQKCIDAKEGKKDGILTVKKEILESLEKLKGQWKTDAGETFFEEQNNDWTKQVDNYIHIIDGVIQLLDVAIREYQEIEEKARKLDI